MKWTPAGLAGQGFRGFVRFSQLPNAEVPLQPGVYAIVREGTRLPAFTAQSTAGWFKGKDPAVAIETLRAAWVPEAQVLYIGKAGAGKSGKRGLKKRLEEYRRHGAGAPVGHWGGRYLWQLADSGELLVCWKVTEDDEAESVEPMIISEFVADYGVRPFANRKLGLKL